MAADTGPFAGRNLAEIELFRTTDDSTRKRIEQRCRWRKYQPDETVIERESPGQEVHFIVSGMVRVVDYSASGREISFEDIGEGGIVGELSAIDGGERSASVVAVQPTISAALDQRSFVNVLADHPEAGLQMMRRLARMVRQASGRIMELSTLGAQNRVHAELLRLARKAAGESAVKARIYPIPVHSDIASRVSTTRETVARVLGDLSRDGIAKRDGNALVIPDVAALEELVERVRGE